MDEKVLPILPGGVAPCENVAVATRERGVRDVFVGDAVDDRGPVFLDDAGVVAVVVPGQMGKPVLDDRAVHERRPRAGQVHDASAAVRRAPVEARGRGVAREERVLADGAVREVEGRAVADVAAPAHVHLVAREDRATDAAAAGVDAAAGGLAGNEASARCDRTVLDEPRLHVDARARLLGGREHAVGDGEALQRGVCRGQREDAVAAVAVDDRAVRARAHDRDRAIQDIAGPGVRSGRDMNGG